MHLINENRDIEKKVQGKQTWWTAIELDQKSTLKHYPFLWIIADFICTFHFHLIFCHLWTNQWHPNNQPAQWSVSIGRGWHNCSKKLVVHRTFGFGRISSRGSAEPFGSAESYFNISYRTKIRPNRISNIQNRIVRPNHDICAESLPNLLISHFSFFARLRACK